MQMCRYNTVHRFKRKSKIKRWPIVLSVILIFIVLGFLHLNYNVNPLIENACKEKTSANVLESFNQATKDELTEGYDYSNLVKIMTDSDGNIVLIQTNSVLINILSRNLALNAQERLDTKQQNVQIPLGAFSGFTVFSGLGRPIDINISPVGSIKTKYESKFVTAGINQTLHTIYLIADIDMLLVLPGKDYRFSVSEQVIICESVIVGKVPSIYFQTN